jgi:hypothetical protein
MARGSNGGCLETMIWLVFVSAITAALMFLEAQFIIWGLSMYHVNSGIWPVWLIGSGVEGIMSMAVTAGIRGAKNDG